MKGIKKKRVFFTRFWKVLIKRGTKPGMTWKDNGLKFSLAALALAGLLLLTDAVSQDRRKAADFLDAQGDYEDARRYYRESFNINPFNYNSLVKYAEICLRLNKPREAEIYLEKTLNIYPDMALANYLLSHIQFKKNNLFRSYFHAAAAYHKYKLNRQYQQWYRYMKQNLEALLDKRSSLSMPNGTQSPPPPPGPVENTGGY